MNTSEQQQIDHWLAVSKMIPTEDLRDIPQEFICNYAVALSNPAIGYRLQVTVAHDLLPKGLLILGAVDIQLRSKP